MVFTDLRLLDEQDDPKRIYSRSSELSSDMG